MFRIYMRRQAAPKETRNLPFSEILDTENADLFSIAMG